MQLLKLAKDVGNQSASHIIGPFRRQKQLILVGSLALLGVLGFTVSSNAVGTFAPTITFETSTTQATAHPDARITVDNSASSEALRSVSIDMPDGFWGSLAAVATKCPYTTAAAGACTDASKIGTVTAAARVDNSDVVLHGKVYMTTPLATGPTDFSALDPAWLSIKIDPQVGGVTFPPIVTPARVTVRYKTVTGSRVMGIRTQIGAIPGHPGFDIPRSVTDSHARTINFSLQRVAVDLKSDQLSPQKPLLTNPSSCTASNLVATFGGYDGSTPSPTNVSYQATGCDKVKFRPVKSDIEFTNPVSGTGGAGGDQNTGLTGTVEFPADSASVSSATITLPGGTTINPAAFDNTGGLYMCPPGSVNRTSTTNTYFNPYTNNAMCPAYAKIGTASIETPMLPDPLVADIYFVQNANTPRIAFYADHSVSPSTNPAGIILSIVGISNVSNTPCPFAFCPSGDYTVQSVMQGLPDAPLTKLTFSIDLPPGARGAVSTKIVDTVTQNTPNCMPNVDFTSQFTSNAAVGVVPRVATRVHSQALAGCPALPRSVDLGIANTDTNVTDTTPAIPFSSSPSDCQFDSLEFYITGCTSPAEPASALSPGIHAFTVTPDDSQAIFRLFSIEQPPSPRESDTTAPTTTITVPPSNPTSDTTPTASFTSGESAHFQCSLNSGAFLPCGSSGLSTTGSYTVDPADALIPGDTLYSIAVRAMDDAGNVGSPDTANFKVDVPFAPTFAVSVSTTQARAHPSLDVTITSGSHEDLNDLTLKMPDGFLGGLQGVQSLCPVAVAAGGGCTAASQVGTVDTVAVVDQSIIRISGQVYMTDPIQPGDPAGIYIKIPAKLQDVNLGDINVPVRLQVRGQVQGIDTMAVDIPRQIVPSNGIDGTTQFDLRSITLKLRDNPLAPQPLLTNPSSCDAAGDFAATFKGANGTTTTGSVPFQTTGCDALGFAPTFSATLKKQGTGATPKFGDALQLDATVTASPGEAAIKSAAITMPSPVTIDVSKLGPVCERSEMPNCPESTRVGTATAVSPLLPTGETLSGGVYLLRGDGKSIPDLLVELRGRIAVDLISVNRFVGPGPVPHQVLSTFTNVPDAPLSSFSISIGSFLAARYPTCDANTDSNITGTLGGQNGGAATVLQHTPFDCSAISGDNFKFRLNGKRTTLNGTIAATGTAPKIKRLKIALPKAVTLNTRALKKKLIVTADGKRLKAKCFKASGKRAVTINFCGKLVTKFTFSFKPGSLTAKKKPGSPMIKFTATDATNKKLTATLRLSKKSVKLFNQALQGLVFA